jgi:hypothetical protein
MIALASHNPSIEIQASTAVAIGIHVNVRYLSAINEHSNGAVKSNPGAKL